VCASLAILQPQMKKLGTRLSRLSRFFSPGVILLLSVAILPLLSCKPKAKDDFVRLTNTGKNYYDRGEADKAITALEVALALKPAQPDAHLNLANAYLLANQPE